MTLEASIWADSSGFKAQATPRRPAAQPAARSVVTITSTPLDSVAAPAPLPRAAAFAPQLPDTTNVIPRAASPAVPAASGPKLFNPFSEFLAEAKAFSSEVKGGGGSKRGDRFNTPASRTPPRASALSAARYGVPAPSTRLVVRVAPSTPPPSTVLATPRTKDLATDRGATTVQAVSEAQREQLSDSVKPAEPPSLVSPQGVQSATRTWTSLLAHEAVVHKAATKESVATADAISKLPPHKRHQAVAAMQQKAATIAPTAATTAPLIAAPALHKSREQKKAAHQESLLTKTGAAETLASSARATGLPSAQPITATYETHEATISATIAPLDFNNAEHNAAAVKVEKVLREQLERAGREKQESVQPVIKEEPDAIKDGVMQPETKTEPTVIKDEVVFQPEDQATQGGGSPVQGKVAVQLEKPNAEPEQAADDHTRNSNDVSTRGTPCADNPPQASVSQVAKSSLQDVKDELIKLLLEKNALEEKRKQLLIGLEQVSATLIDKEEHIRLVMAKLS